MMECGDAAPAAGEAAVVGPSERDRGGGKGANGGVQGESLAGMFHSGATSIGTLRYSVASEMGRYVWVSVWGPRSRCFVSV
jgi:hypothetical protein